MVFSVIVLSVIRHVFLGCIGLKLICFLSVLNVGIGDKMEEFSTEFFIFFLYLVFIILGVKARSHIEGFFLYLTCFFIGVSWSGLFSMGEYYAFVFVFATWILPLIGCLIRFMFFLRSELKGV